MKTTEKTPTKAPAKTRLVIHPSHTRGDGTTVGQLCEFNGEPNAPRVIETLPYGNLQEQAQKMAVEKFGEDGFEFVDAYTGEPVQTPA